MSSNIGSKIKKIRKEKKLTQDQLANLIGKSTITIRKWESGERTPSLETIKQIAEVFDIPSFMLTDDHEITDFFSKADKLNTDNNTNNLTRKLFSLATGEKTLNPSFDDGLNNLDISIKKEESRLTMLSNLLSDIVEKDTNIYKISKAQLLAPLLSTFGFEFEFNYTTPVDSNNKNLSTVVIKSEKDNYMKVISINEFLEFTDNIYNYVENQVNEFKNKY